MKIIYWSASDQLTLASTLLRFQEYYESPKFKDQIFTLDEYKEWYIQEKGDFTYYTDWSGFNFPSHVVTPFLEGDFNPLSNKETQFLNKLPRDMEFYFIATYGKSSFDTLLHESAHALYYLNRNYRREALEVIEGHKNFGLVKSLVLDNSIGYHEDVLLDEIQAYGLSTRKIPELRKIYLKYISEVSMEPI